MKKLYLKYLIGIILIIVIVWLSFYLTNVIKTQAQYLFDQFINGFNTSKVGETISSRYPPYKDCLLGRKFNFCVPHDIVNELYKEQSHDILSKEVTTVLNIYSDKLISFGSISKDLSKTTVKEDIYNRISNIANTYIVDKHNNSSMVLYKIPNSDEEEIIQILKSGSVVISETKNGSVLLTDIHDDKINIIDFNEKHSKAIDTNNLYQIIDINKNSIVIMPSDKQGSINKIFSDETTADKIVANCIAFHESHFDPRAIGVPNNNGSRDFGIMQINNKYWSDYTFKDGFKVDWDKILISEYNVDVGYHIYLYNRNRSFTAWSTYGYCSEQIDK